MKQQAGWSSTSVNKKTKLCTIFKQIDLYLLDGLTLKMNLILFTIVKFIILSIKLSYRILKKKHKIVTSGLSLEELIICRTDKYCYSKIKVLQ